MKLKDIIINNLKLYAKTVFPSGIILYFKDFFRSRKYHKKYWKLISGKGSLRDIEVVSIEFCSICNLSCRYCFLEKKKRPAFLSLDIYKKLLAEICGNSEYQIKIMEWPISGCFFLHPEYKEIIGITREYKEKYPKFEPWIILNDNMMLFDREKVDFVFDQGVVNQIICSVDGIDKETFEYMRPKADFDKVLENTEYLLRKSKESKTKITVQINNGRDNKCRGRELDSRLKEIFNQAGIVTRWEPLDWNESFHGEQPQYIPNPFFCSFVFESVSLSAFGAITKCCMDLKETTRYGDFAKNSLESIWFSEDRRAFLRLMHEGKRRLIPGCGTCSIGYVNQNKFQ